MLIYINNDQVETKSGETILETARRMGHTIPSLCYAKGAKHKSSCMVCAVQNAANGQIIPSCTTYPTEGMQITTDSEEVRKVRSLSLELLLSDHRADCEAPCAMVCPQKLEIEQMLSYYDAGKYPEAHAVIAAAFALPEIGCDNCKAPCEKACRRGTIDQAVSIREIIKELAGMFDTASLAEEIKIHNTDKNSFQSRLGRFTEKERERLKETVNTPSRCLHCACSGRTECKLRLYATAEGIKRSRYDASSTLPVMNKMHIKEDLWFEQAKCIRCGICVYNSDNGFTFKDRGFGMQVVLPEENRANVSPKLAEMCPTGAIYILRSAFCILLAMILTSCISGSGFSDSSDDMDWLLFRGNSALSGYTEHQLPKNPVLLWSYKSDTRTVSSPVVKGGTTYWCDKRGLVRGVDIHGELAFEYNLATAVEATPMIYDSALYIGRIDGFMTAISLATKDTLWNYETMGQVSASPNIVDFEGQKAVVFGSYDNFLYCVDYQTGEEINRFESGYYLNGAVALWKKYVIFGGCDSWVRIIDCQTGVQTDSLLLEAYVPASPAIMGNYCYVGDYSGNIYKLMLENGKIIRHKKMISGDSEKGSFVSVPAISGEAFYFLSGERNIKAISRINGKQTWEYMLKGNVGESSPVVCDDKLIICTKTGIVSILDASNGKLEWEYDTGEQIVSSPAIIKNHFMILTAKGTLLCFGKK
ncbi:outer membrane protein assembly factor BamB/ferredoxin [Parabacteroides sp. PF5-5]|uniref:outer membrane protein assembly factor BamB family protein n=1 Tax=unclassified Parabacteroides TaxID=2649774 RepID=UPI0024768F26|nr:MULTISPECIES: PQQ-binding-like beta-propeller repeat protein [unclassified Parabacteroides]MDH6303728.1 outer membrane protein assembly factor BamB/ferredoxin [Parabacteroides sp. PH5-39]MDH6314345.1 outer membrane protein assembly factor BamB/ferredoxin [Parabacteroides sp. PF5-13]MDH6318590.1 outer membrane protein assembly factor BamB/ferredoxin [Parabacteroides sp. PH5-13]MDH6322117.1 outer membrane protein assembly factor BamB/ferredoxin [Parabacteroides sp. PH5-8]MDH6325803.1 outer me